MVEGAAGVGKTALLDAFRHLVADAFRPLHASGAKLERELAFGVVRQLFERLLRGLPDAERAAILGGAAGLAAPVLLEPAPTAGPEAGHAAMHGLYWLAGRVAARRPLLLMIDDAHWADTASQTWLAYLARRLDGVALLLVVARRTPGRHGEAAALLTGCRAARGGMHLIGAADARRCGSLCGRRVREPGRAGARRRLLDRHGRQSLPAQGAGDVAAPRRARAGCGPCWRRRARRGRQHRGGGARAPGPARS